MSRINVLADQEQTLEHVSEAPTGTTVIPTSISATIGGVATTDNAVPGTLTAADFVTLTAAEIPDVWTEAALIWSWGYGGTTYRDSDTLYAVESQEHLRDLITVPRLDKHLKEPEGVTDTELAEWILEAQGLVFGRLGRAVFAAEVVEKVLAGPRCRALWLANVPVAEVASVAAPDGAPFLVMQGSSFSPLGGVAIEGASLVYRDSCGDRQNFYPGEWVVTYTGGLDQRVDFDSVVRPQLERAVLMTATDIAYDRNPRALLEREDTIQASYTRDGTLPPQAELIVSRLSSPL